MKKTLILILAAAMLLSLAACAAKKPAPAPSEEPIIQRPVSLTYAGPQTEFVLIDEPVELTIYPETESTVRSVPQGELLEVLAEAFAGNNVWLLVQVRDLKAPSDLIRWVEKEKTRPYDDSMSGMVVSPILLPAGTKVYPDHDGHMQTDSEQVQYASAYGRAVKREDGYILLEVGGELVWAEENAVVIGRK